MMRMSPLHIADSRLPESFLDIYTPPQKTLIVWLAFFVGVFLAERFTHDVIALTSFGIDVDSLNATEDLPSASFDAIEVTVASLMALATKPMSM